MNISATQALLKRLQQAENKAAEQQLQLNKLDARLNTIEKVVPTNTGLK